MAEEVKDDGLSFNPELENTKVIASDPIVPKAQEGKTDDGLVFNGDLDGAKFIQDNSYNIDVSKYEGDVGNGQVYMPNIVGGKGIDVLNQDRADNQGFFEQAGNFLGQAVLGEIVGGTIEGMGYLLDIGSVIDVMQGDEAEWGNFITEMGQGVREGVQEGMEIHTDPSAHGWSKMADSGWWFSNGVSVASTLSMLIPTTGALKALSFLGKGVRATKGMGAVRKAVGLAEEMGTKGRWMQRGLSQAVLSRNIENWMEAHGTYEDYKQSRSGQVDPETGEVFEEDKLNKLASDAASNNWKMGWAMLLQDIPQYLALGKVFNPISKKMENALGAASKKGSLAKLKPWQQKSVAAGATFLGEGGEESYQYLISERAKFMSDLNAGLITEEQYYDKLKDAFGNEEMMTSAFFGGLGGNLFQAAGKGIDSAFTSKTDKEYQERLGKYYTETIKNDASQVSLMYQHLAQADEHGMGELRKTIINEMMLNLTTKALEADRFDQFYETMELISDMSTEDQTSFKESTGEEFSPELAKQYSSEILKKSLEMKELYLKYRNKYGKTTSSRLSRLELENNQLDGVISKKQEEVVKLRKKTETYRAYELDDIHKSKELTEVLKIRNKALRAEHEKETNEQRKTYLEQAISANEAEAEQEESHMSLLKEQKKGEGHSKADKLVKEAAYSATKDDIIAARLIEEEGKTRRFINNQDMAFTKTKEGQGKAQAEEVRKELDGAKTPEQLTQLQVELEASERVNAEDKAKIAKKIAEKKAEVELQIKEAAAIEAVAREKADLERKRQEENGNPKVVPNQKPVEIEDSFEDANFNEEPNATEAILNTDKKIVETEATASRTVPLLNQVGGTNTYQRWLENTENKIGQKFYYKVSTNIFKTNPEGQRLAAEFKKNNKATQEMYDYLPIMVESVDNASRFTYLPAKPNVAEGDMRMVRYKNNYAAQRKIIIDKLVAGENTVTEVKYSSGGDLITDKGPEEGMAAENKLTDLQQITEGGNSIDFLFTNREGEFWTQFKQLDEDFAGKTILLGGLDSDGNTMAYRGGVFIKVRKADGKVFPLRVNLARNTQVQADAISALLIDIVVPIKEGTTTTKKLEWKSFLSDVDPAIREKVKEAMGPEIEFLGGDPSMLDLINMFVYVSDETLGLTSELYTMNHHLVFGGQGERVTPETRNNSETIEKLSTFLRDVKRRQISVKLMNEKRGYKEFIVENKIVSTNATTSGPLFQDTTGKPNPRKPNNKGFAKGRKIQLYLAPLEATPAKVNPNTDSRVQEVNKRRAKTIKMGQQNFNGNLSFHHLSIYGDHMIQHFDTMEQAMAAYDEEITDMGIEIPKAIPVKTAPVKEPKKVIAEAKKLKPKVSLAGIKAPDMSGVVKPQAKPKMNKLTQKRYDALKEKTVEQLEALIAKSNKATVTNGGSSTPYSMANRSAARILIKEKTPSQEKVVPSPEAREPRARKNTGKAKPTLGRDESTVNNLNSGTSEKKHCP